MTRFVIGAAIMTLLGAGPAERIVPQEVPDGRIFPMTLTGIVTDGDQEPLGGVVIRLFVEGVEQTATRSDSTGRYRLDFSTDPERDETVLVCCIPPRSDLVAELALIRESRSDRTLGLWSPCVPRLGARRYGEWSVRLLGRSVVRDTLSRSGCL